MLVMAIQRRPAQAQRDLTPLAVRFDALLRRDQHLARDVARLESLAQRLENISHHSVLARGYALIRDAQGVPVLRARELEAAQSVVIEFSDGKINAKVV